MSDTSALIREEAHGPAGAIRLLALNRPEKRNALSPELLYELARRVTALDADPAARVLVLTGSATVFAAGGDVARMANQDPAEVLDGKILEGGLPAAAQALTRLRKPIIAAVAGPAMGGGCELAMLCDVVLAADNALFGLPEIRLGIPPAMGGTQRLPRLIGMSRAMELCLTGEAMRADEALARGLVSRVLPVEELVPAALDLAGRMARNSLPALMLVKECVGRAFESPLSEGLRFERMAFARAFATHDREEGMAAFLEKRPPNFTDD